MAKTAVETLSLQPFVPSGKDFKLACDFFVDLGFTKDWDYDGECAGFTCGQAKFILQNYDKKDFAQNFMVRIDVSDLDLWWQEIEKLHLDKKYPGVKVAPPKDFPWGREVNIIDPAGVCWHIGTKGK